MFMELGKGDGLMDHLRNFLEGIRSAMLISQPKRDYLPLSNGFEEDQNNLASDVYQLASDMCTVEKKYGWTPDKCESHR